MNSTEKLEAAIEKLGTLRTEPVFRTAFDLALGRDDDGELAIVADPEDMNLALFQFHPDTRTRNGLGEPDDDALRYAELILTLHRTIDAQLAILREAKRQAGDGSFFPWTACDHAALALADAILGES